MKISDRLLFILIPIVAVVGLFVYVNSVKTTSPSSPSSNVTASTTETEVLIIAFGDSLTAGYGLPLHESYPAQLETKLRNEGYSVKVVNAGVSGETTKGNTERALFIRKQNPDIVLLGIGGNDALRYLPIEETETNMRSTIETLIQGERPPRVLLLRMQAPLNAGLDYKRSFDALYETLSEEYGLPLIPFYTKEVFLNPDYKLEDGIHFNKAGYEFIVTEYIFDTVKEMLTR